MRQIYVARQGKTYGPYSEEAVTHYLERGELSSRDQAWEEGCADWVELGTLLAPSEGAALTPPPAPPIADAHDENKAVGEDREAKKAPEKRARTKKKTVSKRQRRFLQGLAFWMQANDYRVGLQPESIDLKKEVWATRAATTIVKLLLKAHASTGISGGADAGKVVEALAPFLSVSDLLGLRVTFKTGQDLLVAICADGLERDEIKARIERIAELSPAVSNFGMRVNGQSTGIWITPLLLFFKEKRFQEEEQFILDNGWHSSFWQKIYLRSTAVNVPRQTISACPTAGLAKVYQNLGATSFLTRFTEKDLATVIQLERSKGALGRQP